VVSEAAAVVCGAPLVCAAAVGLDTGALVAAGAGALVAAGAGAVVAAGGAAVVAAGGAVGEQAVAATNSATTMCMTPKRLSDALTMSLPS
jgi:hypothetical protein